MPSQAASCSTVSAPAWIVQLRLVDRGDRAEPRAPPLDELRRRRVDDDPGLVLARLGRDAAGDQGLGLGVGQLARREPRSRRHPLAHPVDAERPPVVAVEVPRDEVPALAGVDDPVRLDPPLRGLLPPVGVVEPEREVLAREAGDLA